MGKREIIKHLSVLSMFIFLSIIMTYPLAFKLTNSIPNDLGDPLLNTWILAWDVRKIMEFDFTGLFDANIFYPHKNTLAYSEHMLGSAIFALPIIAIFKNPILAYNIILLMGISLSGFGMYLLAYYFSNNRLAAFCAGIIFAFFPWRFAQIGHLQSQVAQWLPLTFLYLHKFIDSRSYKHLLLFTAFFVLQFLSNGYYGLFLSFFIGLFIVIEVHKRGFSDRLFLYKLGLFFLISAILILPLFYPYIKVKHEMGFSRPMGEIVFYSADILSYLSAPYSNRIWGGLAKIFWKPEGELFLGLAAILLAIAEIYSQWTKDIKENSLDYIGPFNKKSRSLLWIINILLIATLVVVLLILIKGGLHFEIFGVRIRATTIYRSLSFVVVLSFLNLLLNHKLRIKLMNRLRHLYFYIRQTKEGYYLLVLILSVLFSFGPIIHLYNKKLIYGPYILLYKFFPGFDGLRVPARFIIMVALAVSVFAAFGIARILGRFEGSLKKFGITVIFSILILFESASIPLHMPSVATGDAIPDVYKWLAAEKSDFAIIELPLPRKLEDVPWKEPKRLYYSTYHWKKLVNGYSGYFPPAYDFLYQEGMKDFPSNASIGLLKQLGIRYLIIHSAEFGEEWEGIKNGLQKHKYTLRYFKQFGEAYVFEWTTGQSEDGARKNGQ